MEQLSIQKFNDVMLDVYAKNQMDLLDKMGDFTVTYLPDTEEIEVKFTINISKHVLINGDITNCIKFKLDFGSIQSHLNKNKESGKNIDVMSQTNRKVVAELIEEHFDEFKQWIGIFNGLADDCLKISDFIFNKYGPFHGKIYGL